jgi:hypothetical protein
MNTVIVAAAAFMRPPTPSERHTQQLAQDGHYSLVRVAILRRGAEPDFERAVFIRGLFDFCQRQRRDWGLICKFWR